MIMRLKTTGFFWLLSVSTLCLSQASYATDKALLNILLANGLISQAQYEQLAETEVLTTEAVLARTASVVNTSVSASCSYCACEMSPFASKIFNNALSVAYDACDKQSVLTLKSQKKPVVLSRMIITAPFRLR